MQDIIQVIRFTVLKRVYDYLLSFACTQSQQTAVHSDNRNKLC